MARRIVLDVIGFRFEHAAADTHALEIDDGFGKYRIARRRHTVRTGIEILAERQIELVVDEAVRRVPLPGIAVLGRDIGGGIDVREILLAPRIGFADGHDSDDRRQTTASYPSSVVRRLSSGIRHLSYVLRIACTLNWPSLQTLSGDQPLPRASAANAASVYL